MEQVSGRVLLPLAWRADLQPQQTRILVAQVVRLKRAPDDLLAATHLKPSSMHPPRAQPTIPPLNMTPFKSANADTSALAFSTQPINKRLLYKEPLSLNSTTDPTTSTITLSALLSPVEIARLDTLKDQCDDKFWIRRLFNRNGKRSSRAGIARRD